MRKDCLSVTTYDSVSYCVFMITVSVFSAAELNPALLPLEWLLGTWESDEPGEGCFPTIKPFRYIEKLHFSHVGQPIINFM